MLSPGWIIGISIVILIAFLMSKTLRHLILHGKETAKSLMFIGLGVGIWAYLYTDPVLSIRSELLWTFGAFIPILYGFIILPRIGHGGGFGGREGGGWKS